MRNTEHPAIGGMKSKHHAQARDAGAVTLVELVVVSVLASIILAAVAAVAIVAEKSSVTVSSTYGAQRRANTVISTAISSLSSAAPLEGCRVVSNPLPGQPSSYSPPTLAVPLGNCAETGPVAPPVAIASPNGMCWYAYSSLAAGLVPPDLRCLVEYPDRTLWSFDWQPLSSATYTSCDMCYQGNDLPAVQIQGANSLAFSTLPNEPSGSTSGVATFAGRVAANDLSPFTFYAATSPTGQPATNPGWRIPNGELATSLSRIWNIGAQITEAGHTTYYYGHVTPPSTQGGQSNAGAWNSI
ncbi:MAG: hypothetical protein M1435_01275 [Actinobacteria bacterium]|nr:hypothetical protein [Actinomycetota bacterium]